MAQFDVYKNTGPDSRRIPYLLDIQSDLLPALATRVVVPLVRSSEYKAPVRRLHPVFDVEGIGVVMLTSDLAGILRSELGAKIGSFASHRDEIAAALDFLIYGF